MTLQIDLNCDAGESYGRWTMGDDEHLIPLMTSVNVACGEHGGDPVVMRRTIELAAQYGVSVGAHPSYPDRQGFGRRVIPMTPSEICDWMITQIGAIQAMARACGVPLRHVKPHGALYNAAMDQHAVAEAIITAIQAIDPALLLVALANSPMIALAQTRGLPVAAEAFVDRGYTAAGRLIGRESPAALITDPAVAAERAVQLVCEQTIKSVDGVKIAIHPQTICIHGDTPGAVSIAQAVRARLAGAGVEMKTMCALT